MSAIENKASEITGIDTDAIQLDEHGRIVIDDKELLESVSAAVGFRGINASFCEISIDIAC